MADHASLPGALTNAAPGSCEPAIESLTRLSYHADVNVNVNS